MPDSPAYLNGYDRWPSKPYKGALCDASVGVGVDALGAPVVLSCGKLAVETVLMGGLQSQIYLCGDCVGPLAAKGLVRRNPRLYPSQV